jgi:hypothetical protein
MKTTGQLSDGIRLGWRAGFDSGSSLDYVYENKPRGKLLVGRMMDRVYLNSAGWAGIRQRKLNIERLLREAIQLISQSGTPAHILDVAAGQGRYVVDALTEYNRLQSDSWHRLQSVIDGKEPEKTDRLESVPPLTVLLRDYSQANVEAARASAIERGLAGVECRQADAFDEASYESLSPRPNIAIVSGLFELFSDNELVSRCLNGIVGAIDDEGYLIYTGQPWHPQIEMIARVLTNRDGEPWIMRRRTQIELDDLVHDAGFEKIKTRVDKRGIFTVSLAKRRRDGRS